jgi:hypothetical protein
MTAMFGHTPAGICVVEELLSAGNDLKSTGTWPVSGRLSNDHQRQPASSLYGKIIDQLYNCTFHVKIIELNTVKHSCSFEGPE